MYKRDLRTESIVPRLDKRIDRKCVYTDQERGTLAREFHAKPKKSDHSKQENKYFEL